ncbi:MAG TPA: RDD family protein [Acidimicrobiia bacterium]|nr:RDD family protein [Acidimicrobiia bacterium]
MRLDERVTIATPEGVTIELVLAGLGSRFIARLLDTTIQIAAILALLLGTNIVGVHGSVLAFVFITVFLVMFVYDVPFELLNGGRTIGKMAAGIRVAGPNGEPVTFLASAIRNILRIVDFLPVFYLVGSVTIVATQRDQRLGDLAGGTVVVRDKFPGVNAFAAAPPTVPIEAVAAWDVSGVNNDEVATIRHFLDRRLSLPWPVRTYFGTTLAYRVAPKVAGLPYNAHPEFVLEGIVVAKQARA